MRSSSLARVVMASLGVSVVITLGCDKRRAIADGTGRHFRCCRCLRPKERALEHRRQ